MNSDEINLLDLIRIVKKRVKLLFFFPFLASVIIVSVALLIQPTYRAKAVIMPLGQSSSAGGLLNLLGGGGSSSSLSGLATGLMGGGNTSSSKLMAVLDSRTLIENVIEKSGLAADPEFSSLSNKTERMVEKFRKKLFVSDDKKKSVIMISFDSKNKVMASHVLDIVLDELSQMIQSYQLDTSKKNRIFIEGRLEGNRKDMLEAGKDLTEYYKNKNVSSSLPEIDVSVAEPNQIDISVENIQGNIVEMENKNEAIKAALVKGVPQQVYLEYLIQRKQVLIILNALLSQQYELARIEEARESTSFQVLDKPRVPEGKYSPKIKLMGLIGFVMAFFCALFYVFAAEYINKLKELEKK